MNTFKMYDGTNKTDENNGPYNTTYLQIERRKDKRRTTITHCSFKRILSLVFLKYYKTLGIEKKM